VREILSYLVRIYRRDGDAIAGLVEQVRSGKPAPFATAAELSELLSGRRPFHRRPIRRLPTGDIVSPTPIDREPT
jgi:hypothetical protein